LKTARKKSGVIVNSLRGRLHGRQGMDGWVEAGHDEGTVVGRDERRLVLFF